MFYYSASTFLNLASYLVFSFCFRTYIFNLPQYFIWPWTIGILHFTSNFKIMWQIMSPHRQELTYRLWSPPITRNLAGYITLIYQPHRIHFLDILFSIEKTTYRFRHRRNCIAFCYRHLFAPVIMVKEAIPCLNCIILCAVLTK